MGTIWSTVVIGSKGKLSTLHIQVFNHKGSHGVCISNGVLVHKHLKIQSKWDWLVSTTYLLVYSPHRVLT